MSRLVLTLHHTKNSWRVCHVLRVERARKRLRPPLQLPVPGARPIVAYAHSVFATSCASNEPATASARPSSSLIISPRAPFPPHLRIRPKLGCLLLRVERVRQRLRPPLQLRNKSPVPGAVASFGHAMQSVGDMRFKRFNRLLRFKCFNRPEDRRFERASSARSTAPAGSAVAGSAGTLSRPICSAY